jgi:hypothetical protein
MRALVEFMCGELVPGTQAIDGRGSECHRLQRR